MQTILTDHQIGLIFDEMTEKLACQLLANEISKHQYDEELEAIHRYCHRKLVEYRDTWLQSI